MEPSDDNYFNLPNAHNCICRIKAYRLSHPFLTIWILEPESSRFFLLHFTQVYYFQGASDWIGANFTKESFQESVDWLTKNLQHSHDYAEETVSAGNSFFIVKTANPEIRILAQKAVVTS